MREILEALLTREGYEVRLAPNAGAGLELVRSMPFDAAIVDVMMPGMDGISALDEIKKIDDDLPVLMITAFASVENAIAAMKRGAFDYITKPFKNDEVLVVLRNALAQRRLVVENRALRQNLQAHQNRFGEIIGRSSRMRQVFDLIIQAAPSPDDDPDQRRERHRQGARRARAPSEFGARRPRVHHGQLRQPAAGPARVEPVRPREGRVHRRRLPEEGAVRARRQGHDLLRRDRQHPARDAGQAPARHPGARVHAPRRRRDDQGRRAHHRRDQRRPAADDGRRDSSARTSTTASTSSPCSCRRCASARTTSRSSSSTSSRSTASRTRRTGWSSPPRRSTC